jgi:hypothetical protein
MGMLPVPIGDDYTVRVKYNVSSPAGWHLWMSLWRNSDGEMVATLNDVEGDFIVPDIEDGTLERAAGEFAAQVLGAA